MLNGTEAAGAAGALTGPGGATPGGAAGSANSTGGGNSTGGASAAGANATGGVDSHGGTAGDSSSLAGATASGGVAGAASGGAGGMSTNGWAFPAGVIKPRIMIVGDSISAGPGCYKKYLLKDLTANGSKFEFVGEYTDDCGGGVMHSAVSCSTAEQYTHDMFMMPNCQQGKTFLGLAPLATKHKPDLVMLQLGVNDVWGGAATQTTLGRYKTLVEQARAQNPNVVLAVAQIQKIRPNCGSDDSIQKRAEDLVKAVPAWAQQLSTPQSPVFVADLWTNSDWSMAETLDCVHPNDIGAQKMGMNWFNALKSVLPHG